MSEPRGVLFACPVQGVGRPLAKRLKSQGETLWERIWFTETSLPEETPAAAFFEMPLFDGNPNPALVAEWIWHWHCLLPPATRMILISSALVYGQPLRQPVLEVDPLLPSNAAGLSASLAETVCLHALRGGDRKGCVVRLGEIGPGGEQQGSWMDLGLQSGNFPIPSEATELSVLGLEPALHALEALLAPQGLPAPHPAQVYNLAATPRPAAMVMQDLKNLTRRDDMALTPSNGSVVLPALHLNTALARGHLGLPHALGRLLESGGQEIS